MYIDHSLYGKLPAHFFILHHEADIWELVKMHGNYGTTGRRWESSRRIYTQCATTKQQQHIVYELPAVKKVCGPDHDKGQDFLHEKVPR